MSAPSSSNPVENPIGNFYAVRHARRRAGGKVSESCFKGVKNLSDVWHHWTNRVRENSRSASENSDEWAESHLFMIASVGLGAGLILGVVFALP